VPLFLLRPTTAATTVATTTTAAKATAKPVPAPTPPRNLKMPYGAPPADGLLT
jgi:hypothetical protein